VGKRDEFRDLLIRQDVRGLLRAWSRLAPQMPQLQSREQAEIVMHHARTQADSLPLRHRAYSHQWLTERDLPSGLPDALKPHAERIYPAKSVPAVGLSVNFRSKYMRGAEGEVRGVMENSVLESYADGKQNDPAFVHGRMMDAKDRAMKTLFG
jgi:hypothetical protein